VDITAFFETISEALTAAQLSVQYNDESYIVVVTITTFEWGSGRRFPFLIEDRICSVVCLVGQTRDSV